MALSNVRIPTERIESAAEFERFRSSRPRQPLEGARLSVRDARPAHRRGRSRIPRGVLRRGSSHQYDFIKQLKFPLVNVLPCSPAFARRVRTSLAAFARSARVQRSERVPKSCRSDSVSVAGCAEKVCR